MKKLRTHAISGVFVFLLLGIFAVLSTVTVLLGANAYRNSGARSDEHNAQRLLSAYARSRLRAVDEYQSVSTGSVQGTLISYDDEDNELTQDAGSINCLTLAVSSDENETIVDRIYVYDGYLMERMQELSEPFEPDRGMKICPAQGMDCAIEGTLLTLTLQNGEQSVQLDIALRSANTEVEP